MGSTVTRAPHQALLPFERAPERIRIVGLARGVPQRTQRAAVTASMQHSPAASFLVRAGTGEIDAHNLAAERLLHLNGAQIAGRTIHGVFEAAGGVLNFHSLDGSLDVSGGNTRFELPLRNPDGATRHLTVTVRALNLDRQRHLEFYLEENSREEAAATPSMDALHAVYGEVHDARNLANLIQLLCATGTGDPAATLAKIGRTTPRLAALMQQVLSQKKGEREPKQLTSLAGIIEGSAELVLTNSPIRCEIVMAPDLWSAEVALTQIYQVLDNLVLNAKEAMPSGGNLRIRARNMEITQESNLSLPPGPYAHIEVEDEGTGIPADVLSRIFEPFFTTKKKGTGLGLANCARVMEEHGGKITVESRTDGERRGTTFHIYLPASRPVSVCTAPASIGKTPVTSLEGMRLLIVDDNEDSATSLAILLKLRMKCKTRVAFTPQEAIRIFDETRAAGEPIDMLVTDFSLHSEMDGKGLFDALRARQPQIAGVLVSGWEEKEVRELGFHGILRKPLNMDTMSEALLAAFNAA